MSADRFTISRAARFQWMALHMINHHESCGSLTNSLKDQAYNKCDSLLAAVLQAPPHSQIRARAFSNLIRYLQHLPGIKKVAHQDYALALNQTWEWLNREIDRFQCSRNSSSEQDLVRWINGYLKWRIRDLYFPQTTDPPTFSLDASRIDTDETYLNLLADNGFIGVKLCVLDQNIADLQKQETQEIAQQIEAWIMTDPDRELQKCHLKNHPQCHCQLLSQRLLMEDPPDKLTKIAQDLNIPYQTLVSHWKRNCLTLLRTKATNLENI
jgi:hypothetical protein